MRKSPTYIWSIPTFHVQVKIPVCKSSAGYLRLFFFDWRAVEMKIIKRSKEDVTEQALTPLFGNRAETLGTGKIRHFGWNFENSIADFEWSFPQKINAYKTSKTYKYSSNYLCDNQNSLAYYYKLKDKCLLYEYKKVSLRSKPVEVGSDFWSFFFKSVLKDRVTSHYKGRQQHSRYIHSLFILVHTHHTYEKFAREICPCQRVVGNIAWILQQILQDSRLNYNPFHTPSSLLHVPENSNFPDNGK